MERTGYLLAIQKHMPKQSAAALEYFTESNPHWRGAQWADALDLLLEADAHVEMTDAIYDDLRVVVPVGTEAWILPVFMTLLYSNKGIAPYATSVAYWHGFVTGALDREKLITG